MDTEMGDIIESVKSYVLGNLPYKKSDAKVTLALKQKSPEELLSIFLNWKSRYVTAKSRSVFESSAFCNNPVRMTRSAEIEKVISEIEAGADLTPRLSKRIRNGFVLPIKTKSLATSNRPDLDLLLNDWSIHHLHIALPPADGSVSWDDDLIFVIFRNDKAFLIDIYPHKKWAAKVIFETAVKAWPDENLSLDLGLEVPINNVGWSDEDRQKLRNNGFVTTIVVDGKTYAGRGSMSNAGISMQIPKAAFETIQKLQAFENCLSTNFDKIVIQLKDSGVHFSDTPIFEYRYFEEGVGVVEKSTGTKILLACTYYK
jgi:hypothetical protein